MVSLVLKNAVTVGFDLLCPKWGEWGKASLLPQPVLSGSWEYLKNLLFSGTYSPENRLGRNFRIFFFFFHLRGRQRKSRVASHGHVVDGHIFLTQQMVQHVDLKFSSEVVRYWVSGMRYCGYTELGT